jgi:hypothetical protein
MAFICSDRIFVLYLMLSADEVKRLPIHSQPRTNGSASICRPADFPRFPNHKVSSCDKKVRTDLFPCPPAAYTHIFRRFAVVPELPVCEDHTELGTPLHLFHRKIPSHRLKSRFIDLDIIICTAIMFVNKNIK